jgi:hypothetical protein
LACHNYKFKAIMSAGKRFGQALPYPVFMQRQRVLGLYRSMLKSVQRMNRNDIQVDVTLQIKTEFTNNKRVKDAVSLRALMSEGTRQLAVLQDMESTLGAASETSSQSNTNSISTPAVMSWLDSSTEHDAKGRVGEGWPWQ